MLCLSSDDKLLGFDIRDWTQQNSTYTTVYFLPSHFSRRDGDITAQCPVVSTCTDSLQLPVVPKYEQFSGNMLMAFTVTGAVTIA